MKKLLLLLCALLLTGCIRTYDGPVVQERVLVKVTEEHYWYPYQDQQTIYQRREEYAYDIYGNLARTLHYQDGELQSEYRMDYDSRGNETSRTLIDHTAWIPHATVREERTYDESNRVTSFSHRDFRDGEEYRYEYQYDDATGTVTTRHQNGEAQSTHSYRNIVDEAGRTQKKVYAEGDEDCYFYDDAGNLTRLERWREGALESYSDMTYDEQNRLLREVWCDMETENETTYEYWQEQGGFTCIRYTGNGGYRQEDCYDNGQPITILEVDQNGNITMEQHYFYDDIDVPKEE